MYVLKYLFISTDNAYLKKKKNGAQQVTRLVFTSFYKNKFLPHYLEASQIASLRKHGRL